MADGRSSVERGWAWFYRNWAKAGLLVAVYESLLLVLFGSSMGVVLFLVWVQVPIYLLHQFEEHAWPGGFQRLVNERLFGSSRSDFPLDDRTVFWANVPITWVLFPASAALAHFDARLGVWLAVFGAFNATLHLLVAIRFRTYNPGLAVSSLLNVPVGSYALVTFFQFGVLTGGVAVASLGLTVALHLLLVLRVRRQLATTGR